MGVYIKGMEMPNERESFTITVKYNGLVFDTETGIQIAEAQEVPPHGRLIDADEYKQEMKDCRMAFWDEVLDSMPTVIPAEEGET